MLPSIILLGVANAVTVVMVLIIDRRSRGKENVTISN